MTSSCLSRGVTVTSVVAAFLFLGTGCDLSAPKYPTVYQLISVDGRSLPSQVDTLYVQSGDQVEQQIAQLESGSLVLRDGGLVDLRLTYSFWVNGAPRKENPVLSSSVPGSYSVEGDSASFHVDNATFKGGFADERREVTIAEVTGLYNWQKATFRRQ